ncbi:MAG: hypothetical protein IJ737_06855 [Ruminococcus sp.]|nr:hypothetical protein [Ruminococcus sp.]
MMESFRKNKGIVVELTSLLDVILIMMFWLLMNLQESKTNLKEEADSRIAEAQSAAQEEIDAANADADARIAEAMAELETTNRMAVERKNALEEYEEGGLLQVSLEYDSVGQVIILNQEEELGMAVLEEGSTRDDNSREIAAKMIAILEEQGIQEDDVVICAFIYNGRSSYYADVHSAYDALEEVSRTYKYFYWTKINTAR